jgi:hypothetical protein
VSTWHRVNARCRKCVDAGLPVESTGCRDGGWAGRGVSGSDDGALRNVTSEVRWTSKVQRKICALFLSLRTP